MDGGRWLWLGDVQDTAARTAVREGKKSVEPKPEENLLSQCQEALPHPACSDLLLPLLGSNARSTHHPCLLWRGHHCEIPRRCEDHHCEIPCGAVGVRASGRIADLLGDGGSGFKGEISDAGCDHPFSPLLPALTLVSAVFSACTSFRASLLLRFIPMLCSVECFRKSSFH